MISFLLELFVQGAQNSYSAGLVGADFVISALLLLWGYKMYSESKDITGIVLMAGGGFFVLLTFVAMS